MPHRQHNRGYPREALDAYGAVHLLCNNAGVSAGSTAWESTINDWQWALGVNLWGTLYGIRVFMPIMLDQVAEGHIANTASIAGLISYSPDAPCHLSKHAVVALSEKLYCDLTQRGASVQVSGLCPGLVNTRIMDGERNRPADLQDDHATRAVTPEMLAALEAYRQSTARFSLHRLTHRPSPEAGYIRTWIALPLS
jgi:NAD(P)-dependent dehydrogenase (short-subunit alcohol dehydrogenase family)